MKPRLASLVIGTALALLISGCESPDTNARIVRIQEKQTYYYTLSPYLQRAIEDGVVEVDYTDDMTYMALGKPDRIVTSADGEKIMWVYYKYFPTTTAARVTLNSTNARNSGHMTSANTPYAGSGGAGAPRSFSSTAAPLTQSMELPDLTSDTLYVFFRDKKVVEIQLESKSPTPQ